MTRTRNYQLRMEEWPQHENLLLFDSKKQNENTPNLSPK